jgi:hypothetical protein
VADSIPIRPFVTQVVELLRGRMLTSAEARLLHEAFAPLILAVAADTPEPDTSDEKNDTTLSEAGIREDERRHIALRVRAAGMTADSDEQLAAILKFRETLSSMIEIGSL